MELTIIQEDDATAAHSRSRLDRLTAAPSHLPSSQLSSQPMEDPGWSSAVLGALDDPEMLAAALAVLEGDALLPIDVVDDVYEPVRKAFSGELALTGAFVDELDVEDRANDGDRSSSPNSSSSSNSETDRGDSVDAIVPSAKRRTRFRPKQELMQLRKKELELAAKLRELRLNVVEAASGDGSGISGRRNSLLFWERAAARQFMYRQRSEQENRRLKSLLQAQIRQARVLQQAINRRLTESKQPDLSASLSRRVPADNTAVFHSILSYVDQLYTKLEAFCTSVHANDVYEDGTWSDPSETDVDKSIPFGWHAGSTVVPFSVPQVQRAAWLSRGATEIRTNPHFYRNFVQYSGDILLSSASTLAPQAPVPIYLQSQLVARMFVERGRSVFISRALVVPKDLNSGDSLGVKFEETSVYIFTPTDGSETTTLELHATIAQRVDPSPRAAYWKQPRSLHEARQRWFKALESRSELIEEYLATA